MKQFRLLMLAMALVLSGFVPGRQMIIAQAAGMAANMQAAGENFRLVRLATKLENPWSLAFLPDGRFLVSERVGRLLILGQDGSPQSVQGLPPVRSAGQGGLLDLALHPEFASNRLVYWTYARAGSGGSATALARGRLEGNRLEAVQILWVMPLHSAATQHYGSRIRFGLDGKIYLTTGDRGDQNRARRPGDAAGKVIRLNDDGSIPADNPFIGRSAYLPEIYSLGHRNAQGLAVRPGNGQLWLSEHGPRGGDEINLVKPGLDYGWPLTTYGVAYSGARIAESPTAPGIEPPVLHWTPSIAPSGLEFYSGTAFPRWQGHLISGSLAGQKLVLLELASDRITGQQTILDGQIGRIRDVRVGPDGLVYLLTDDSNGSLYRLDPLSRNQP